MPVLGMIYPSLVFATECDPLRLGSRWFCQAMTPSREELLDLVKTRLETLLAPLIDSAEQSDSPDYDWYWAAPVLLDFKHYPEATQAWFDQPGLAWDWKGEADLDQDQADDTAWEDHVELARKAAGGHLKLGRPPSDLLEVLSEIALAGPGTWHCERSAGCAKIPPQSKTNGCGRLPVPWAGLSVVSSRSRKSRR